MKSKRANYKSYLLRLWREDGRGQWHASLQSTATEQTMHFADLAILLAFLESEVPKVSMEITADGLPPVMDDNEKPSQGL